MAVLHDYECSGHGAFESMDGKCPFGCSKSFVTLVFKKAPAYGNPRTKKADQTLKELAAAHGMTDIRNDKDGSSVMQSMGGLQKIGGKHFTADDPRASGFAPGIVRHNTPGWSQRGEKAQTFDVKAMGAEKGIDIGALGLSKRLPTHGQRFKGEVIK